MATKRHKLSYAEAKRLLTEGKATVERIEAAPWGYGAAMTIVTTDVHANRFLVMLSAAQLLDVRTNLSPAVPANEGEL